MTHANPEPDDPAADPLEADDWGDAMQVVHDRDGRSSVLPQKRSESANKAVVNVIDHEKEAEAAMQEAVAEPQAEPSEPLEPAPKKLMVREIAGRKVVESRPERPIMPIQAGGTISHAKAMTDRMSIEEKEWRHTETFQTKWIVIMTVVVVGLIIGCLALLPLLNRTSRSGRANAVQFEAVEEQLMVGDQVLETLMLSELEAKRIYTSYTTSKQFDEVLPLLLHPKQMEPLLRGVDRGVGVPSDWQADGASWQVVSIQNHSFGILIGDFPNFDSYQAYFVVNEGRLVMDWKATYGYGTATFEELRKGQGDASGIRGVLVPESLYTLAYPEADYLSFRLDSPDGKSMVWCYVARDSEIANDLGRAFGGSGSGIKVHLALKRGGEDALNNQWLIDRLRHEEWLDLDGKDL